MLTVAPCLPPSNAREAVNVPERVDRSSCWHDGPVPNTPQVLHGEPLLAVALDAERHVASAGWDQPLRLFALVPTADLLAREPHLADQLSESDRPGALTAVEQEGMPPSSSVASVLGRVAWPDEVCGAAVAVERIVVPPGAERDLPVNPDDAADILAAHPDRKDVRLLVAVTREGSSVCLLRQREHDHDDKVARGSDIAPGLVHALLATFDSP